MRILDPLRSFVLAAASSVWAAVDYLAQFVRLRPDHHGHRPPARPGP